MADAMTNKRKLYEIIFELFAIRPRIAKQKCTVNFSWSRGTLTEKNLAEVQLVI